MSNTADRGDELAGYEVRAKLEREQSPAVSDADYAVLTRDINRFACDLYEHLRGRDGNLLFSPFSVSLALAMTYAGAKGETASQMAAALHYTLPETSLHGAFNRLDLELIGRGAKIPREQGTGFTLEVANAIWGQIGVAWLDPFLDTLAANYGAGLRALDFATAWEAGRETINAWVERNTLGKIRDLLPAGSVSGDTRLVLTNAVYFKATWAHEFDPAATKEGVFTPLTGRPIHVPMMTQTASFGYAVREGYIAVSLPYVGHKVSMILLVPDGGTFPAFEQTLNADILAASMSAMEHRRLTLTLPRFEFETSLSLKETLTDLGMELPFSNRADFSGMTEDIPLAIDAVVQKAFVKVDEQGTEAAAATAVGMMVTSLPPPPIEVTVDRPFVFVIRDKTGTLVFLGRVTDPS